MTSPADRRTLTKRLVTKFEDHVRVLVGTEEKSAVKERHCYDEAPLGRLLVGSEV